jgi:hypothetical protein
MTTRKRVLAKAQQLGCLVNVSENRELDILDVEIEAPHRKLFLATQTHAVVCCNNDEAWGGVWRELWKDLLFGFDDCVDPDCDWCNP